MAACGSFRCGRRFPADVPARLETTCGLCVGLLSALRVRRHVAVLQRAEADAADEEEPVSRGGAGEEAVGHLQGVGQGNEQSQAELPAQANAIGLHSNVRVA